jgi:hypothetical protein
MKNIKFLFLSLITALSMNSYASLSDDVHMGVSLMGSKTDKKGDYQLEGVILFAYDGLGFELSEDKDLRILPTDSQIAINGKMVQVYTNAATLEYYVTDDFELAVSALSVDYKKFNDFSVRKSEKMAALSTSATKYIAVGSLVIDASVSVALAGRTRDELFIGEANDRITVKDTHYYTVGAKIGVDIPVTNKFRVYAYARAEFQKGDETEKTSFSAGLELYEGLEFFNLHFTPHIDYVTERVNYGNSSVDDSMLRFGLRLDF